MKDILSIGFAAKKYLIETKTNINKKQKIQLPQEVKDLQSLAKHGAIGGAVGGPVLAGAAYGAEKLSKVLKEALTADNLPSEGVLGAGAAGTGIGVMGGLSLGVGKIMKRDAAIGKKRGYGKMGQIGHAILGPKAFPNKSK